MAAPDPRFRNRRRARSDRAGLHPAVDRAGVFALEEDIIDTAGALHACELLADALANASQQVGLEELGHPHARVIGFGIDATPKALLIVLSCAAPLALAACSGMRNASPEQVDAACRMGAS